MALPESIAGKVTKQQFLDHATEINRVAGPAAASLVFATDDPTLADANPGYGWIIYAAPQVLSATPVNIGRNKAYRWDPLRTSMDCSFIAPTPGNVLVGVIAVDKSSGAATTPAGWTQVQTQSGASVSYHAYIKIADGSETSVSFAWTTAQRGSSCLVLEYPGLSTTVMSPSLYPYDDSVSTTATFSATNVAAAGLALSFFMQDSISALAEDTRQPSTITGGFTYVTSSPELPYAVNATGGEDGTTDNGLPALEVAAKMVSAAESPSITWTAPRGDNINGGLFVLGLA